MYKRFLLLLLFLIANIAHATTYTADGVTAYSNQKTDGTKYAVVAISVVSGDVVMWWSHIHAASGCAASASSPIIDARGRFSADAASTTYSSSAVLNLATGNPCGVTATGIYTATTTGTFYAEANDSRSANIDEISVIAQRIRDVTISDTGCTAFSCLTGTPTSLSGYGITDGVSTSRTLTIDGSTFDLSANRTWGISSTTLVKTSRTLTINGTTFDLSADRSWTISAGCSTFGCLTGKPTTLSGYGITDAVPSSRTLTISTSTYDLSADRVFYIASSTGSGTSTAIYVPPSCLILGSDISNNITCMGTTTIPITNANADVFYGIILFVIGMIFAIWLFKRT